MDFLELTNKFVIYAIKTNTKSSKLSWAALKKAESGIQVDI